MRNSHPERFDLNLLLVFEALMRGGNVTQAANKLGVTQPTLSHALTRLRKLCDDSLFVRTPKGMEPTAYARAMADGVIGALSTIRRSLSHREDFDPARDERVFRLLLTDIGIVTFLPGLIKHLENTASMIRIETSFMPQDEYKEALQSGAFDLAIGQIPPIVSGFYQQRLFAEDYVGVVGAQHPRFALRPSLQAYLGERHIRVVLPGRPVSPIDQALADEGLVRDVMVTVPQYLALLPILAASELVATVSVGVFQALRRSGELKMFTLPFNPPKVVVRQFWHERNHADPGLSWLRMTISTLFASASPVLQGEARAVTAGARPAPR